MIWKINKGPPTHLFHLKQMLLEVVGVHQQSMEVGGHWGQRRLLGFVWGMRGMKVWLWDGWGSLNLCGHYNQTAHNGQYYLYNFYGPRKVASETFSLYLSIYIHTTAQIFYIKKKHKPSPPGLHLAGCLAIAGGQAKSKNKNKNKKLLDETSPLD